MYDDIKIKSLNIKEYAEGHIDELINSMRCEIRDAIIKLIMFSAFFIDAIFVLYKYLVFISESGTSIWTTIFQIILFTIICYTLLSIVDCIREIRKNAPEIKHLKERQGITFSVFRLFPINSSYFIYILTSKRNKILNATINTQNEILEIETNTSNRRFPLYLTKNTEYPYIFLDLKEATLYYPKTCDIKGLGEIKLDLQQLEDVISDSDRDYYTKLTHK